MLFLYEIAKAINESPDLDSLYPQIQHSLGKIIDTTNFYIGLYNEKNNIISFPYFTDERDDDFDIIDARDSGSLTAEVLNTGKPLFLDKKNLEKRFASGDLKQWGTMPYAWLGVPLREKNKLIGVIAVQSYNDPNLYCEEDILVLESVSEQIAMAIHSKHIEEEKKKLEAQLFQAQKMESVGRLAGGIAHDFNNILTGIMGYAELLKLQFPDLSSREGQAAHIILKGAKRAAELTKQLLGFARGGKYNPLPLDINKIIEDTVNVSGNIFEKNITPVYELEININTIEADKNQMAQVLTNLIINARDAMPGGGLLTFRTENVSIDQDYVYQFPELLPGPYVKISITDTGIGMSSEIKAHIFEPFFSTKGEGKGTGLGLATVYGIVKNHHGHITVESKVGEGTTFSLYFPTTQKKIIAVKKEHTVIKGNATILVVDDEEIVRRTLKEMLTTMGYKIRLAENGKKAISLYKKNPMEIDLVLLDIIMPQMAGKETFHRLKKINPQVKVLLASGYSQDAKATDILNDGALDFVQKPFNLEELSIKINQALMRPI